MSTKIRYHGLDFARSALLLLGVFYHTALIFRGDNTWRVTSEFSSNFLFWLTDFTTSFRMEGFYLVSGFFLFLAYEQNKSNILIQRIQRIFIPMMFMAFTFNQYLMHASYNYNYTDNFKYYIILGQWLEHLWFLGNLIGYFFFGRLFSLLLLARKSKPRLNLKIVLTIAPISSLLLVPVTEFFYYPVYFFITIDSFFYYLPYFFIGIYLCYRKTDFFNTFSIYFGITCIFLSIAINFLHDSLTLRNDMLLLALKFHEDGFLTFGLVALLINLGRSPTKLTRYISDSSYTIYLLHTPFIVFIYIYIFEQSDLNPYIIYFIICAFTIIFTTMSHSFIVSRFKIARFLLNGKL